MIETLRPFVHPETGELLSTRAELHSALIEINERMEPLFRVRRRIRDAYTERFEATLPPWDQMTDKQQRISLCPRCGLAQFRGDPE